MLVLAHASRPRHDDEGTIHYRFLGTTTDALNRPLERGWCFIELRDDCECVLGGAPVYARRIDARQFIAELTRKYLPRDVAIGYTWPDDEDDPWAYRDEGVREEEAKMTIGGHYWWKVRGIDAPTTGKRELLCAGADRHGQPWRVEADMRDGESTNGFLFLTLNARWLPEMPAYRFQKSGNLREIVVEVLKRHFDPDDLGTICWADSMALSEDEGRDARIDLGTLTAEGIRALTDAEILGMDAAAHPAEDRSGVRAISGAVTKVADEHGNLTVLVSTMVLVPPKRAFQVRNIGRGE